MFQWKMIALSVMFGFSAQAQAANCRDRIPKLVCLVKSPAQISDGTIFSNLPCEAGGEKYIPFFESHFDRSPAIIQETYCHLSKLMIATDLPGSARTEGGAVGIRKEFLDAQLPFDRWYSWRDETSFGSPHSSIGPSLGIIHYKSNNNTVEQTVDFLIDHEFGHVWRSLTRHDAEWFSFSWIGFQSTPKPEADFLYRKDLCFYFCNGKFADTKKIPVVLSGLMKAPFATLYSATGAEDDWADAFALYFAVQNGLQLEASVNGQTFDITGHFNSPLLSQKRQYIEDFIHQQGF